MGIPAAHLALERGHRPRVGWGLVAASATVGLVLGAVGASLVNRGSDPDRTGVGPAPSPTVRGPAAVALRTSTGTEVGTLTPSFSRGRPVLVMSVHSMKVGMSYVCRLRMRDGSEIDVADWRVRSPVATWVIDKPSAEAEELLLVAHDGAGPTWSRARL
jgi:hypothetical protein